MSKIKIGLFGFGTVGQGIYEVVRKSKNADAEIVKICVRSLDKPRAIDRRHFTDSASETLENPEINLRRRTTSHCSTTLRRADRFP